MTSPRVLPPDVFDALELSALAFGGIGAGRWYNSTDKELGEGPFCAVGHAAELTGSEFGRGTVERALNDVGIGEEENDVAVCGAPYVVAPRISFAKWCRRLNVVRGDEPTFDPANFPPIATKKRGSRPSRSRRSPAPKGDTRK